MVVIIGALNLLILFAMYMIWVRNKEYRFSIYASFAQGIIQVLYLFFLFFTVFRYTGSTGNIIMPISVSDILYLDILGLHFYLIFFYIYFHKSKKIFTSNIMFPDFLQLFLPSFLLNTALIFIVQLDLPLNQDIYRIIINRYFSIMIFKGIYTLSHFLIYYIISNGISTDID